MRHAFWWRIGLGIWLWGGWPVSGDASSEKGRQCLLEHVKPASSSVAAQYLQQACARRFPDEPKGSDLTIRTEPEDGLAAYDHCLFRQLAGVQNDASAVGMEQFCHDQFHPGAMGGAEGHKPATTLFDLLNRLDGGSGSRTESHSAPRIDGDGFVPLAPARAGR